MLLFACFDLCVSVLGLCICVFLFVEQRYRMIQFYLKSNSEYNMVGDDGDNGAARPNGKRCPLPLISTYCNASRYEADTRCVAIKQWKTQVFLEKCQQLIKVQFSSEE